ncbi:type 1 glutamine amidotransferase domain-containing protein [Mechercharimyces sp. CAU 1602]|uniref:type 1 glutamine amidotransferase domain-containing protein n=1 Tax=Mechercharimyces sp. CAU 1602 TaxID=2973933 RepID=UPI002161CCCF|nr:type 1 glutamine amidotransferase domain-containing protein [Mechercharimyces sp. CAU 1602]MCS1350925.1 type 1 glutamine amidotransferase domain-containing protein [Mechercharimyces sp. CAU 1602]
MSKSILFVITNHDTITNDIKTGFWLEELSVPYDRFKEKGYDITLSSPEGGKVPVDPNSISSKEELASAEALLKQCERTERLANIDVSQFDAIFLPGGHGTMFDFPDHEPLIDAVESLIAQNKVVAAVCHGPAGLVNVKDKDGNPLVAGKRVSAFTDSEEKAVDMVEYMPFLLESKLRELGAEVITVEDWQGHVEVDGTLVTGQNPQSSQGVAEEVIKILQR